MTLAFQHRQRQLVIRNATLARLLSLWRIVDGENLDTVDRFAEASVPVIDVGFGRSAAASAVYYRRLRPPGITTVEVPVPVPPTAAETAGLIRGAVLAGVINGRRSGFNPDRAVRNGFVKMAGSATRVVLDGGRRTILDASQKDPAATGRWQRVTGGDSCDFCEMLAGRGYVYSEDAAGFEAHDHCACVAEPEFG